MKLSRKFVAEKKVAKYVRQQSKKIKKTMNSNFLSLDETRLWRCGLKLYKGEAL